MYTHQTKGNWKQLKLKTENSQNILIGAFLQKPPLKQDHYIMAYSTCQREWYLQKLNNNYFL